MIVYRITLQKWAGALIASGRAARWNTNGHFMIYTAGSRALACLENMVHRSGVGRGEVFKTMLVEIPDNLLITTLRMRDLPPDWKTYANYAACQSLGDAWLAEGTSAVLKVPSAIIPEESNYLIHPGHTDSAKIKIIRTEDFVFDSRLLGGNP